MLTYKTLDANKVRLAKIFRTLQKDRLYIRNGQEFRLSENQKDLEKYLPHINDVSLDLEAMEDF